MIGVFRYLLAVRRHLLFEDVFRAEDEGEDETGAARFVVGEHNPEPAPALPLEVHCRL